MSVVQLAEHTRADLLGTIESIRQAAEAGEIVGLAAVGLEPKDGTRYYYASAGQVTHLRIAGAIAAMEFNFHQRAVS